MKTLIAVNGYIVCLLVSYRYVVIVYVTTDALNEFDSFSVIFFYLSGHIQVVE